MPEVNFPAVGAAAVAAFVASGVWYGVFGSRLKDLGASTESRPTALLLPVELARSLVMATVLAGLASVSGIAGVPGALVLGLALWLGFPVVLLAGSVFHENVPWRLAALHAGDWLVKLTVVSAVIGFWR
ncbi:hypothetical protein HNR06_001044 [Nocardiopsis arvandica]|uniref:DUF1761 domain-containing protein n=1 Tax=Nocardiopsis sinuspersici TaxID=501010 RepID=A0A7Y9XBX3_9ACTN|nr:DUF1761 domain-containing protein [Nocardiopsis sinuspersici]NYH51455.1 hypothetical protein [Nocardiopsis sinuspersici]